MRFLWTMQRVLQVRDGEREGVGGVGGRSGRERQNDADHLGYLVLVCAAVRGDRALDARRRVLEHLDARAGAHEQCDTARVPELGRGLRILVEEDGLDARLGRVMLADERVERLLEHGEASGEGTVAERDHAVGDVMQSCPTAFHDPPPEAPSAGIQAKNNQASLAMSSSEMSKSD